MLQTIEELSKCTGITGSRIRKWIYAGRIHAIKETDEQTGLRLPTGFRYLIDTDEFEEFLKEQVEFLKDREEREKKSKNTKKMKREEKRENTRQRSEIMPNADEVLSYFLGEGGNSQQKTYKHFGLTQYTLCVAFHKVGRDDLIYPSVRKFIAKAYPITNLESLEMPTVDREEGILASVNNSSTKWQ